MIPYVVVPPIELGPITLQPFGILVAIGVTVGISLATRRARYVGLDGPNLQSFVSAILVSGFIGAHVFDSIFYHPAEVVEHPWSLLLLWAGLSSFGGFLGATLGALAWKYFTTRAWPSTGARLHIQLPVRRTQPMPLMRYADVIMAVFPVAWMFGRAGCSVVHDHPGLRVSPDSWLAVAYGAGPVTGFHWFQLRHGMAPRYDLGLLEMLFAVGLSVAFALSWRNRSASGWYVAAASLVYAPARFALDFLRAPDPEGGDLRYGSLTPAQWACLVLFTFGAWLAIRLARNASSTPSAGAIQPGEIAVS